VTREGFARVLPAAGLAAVAWALAWVETGSTVSSDWLPYAFFAGLLLAAVLAAGALRPFPREAAGVAALVGLAGWEALSLTWSAVPNLARDEALLTLFYASIQKISTVFSAASNFTTEHYYKAFTMNAAMARRLKLRYRWPSLRAALLTGAPRAEEGTLPL
jgi:hypothetical protein